MFLSGPLNEERNAQQCGPGYFRLLVMISLEMSEIYTEMRTGETPPKNNEAGYAAYQNTAIIREVTRELDPFLVSAAYYWLRTQGMDVSGKLPDWQYALMIDWYYPGGWEAFLTEHRQLVRESAGV